MLLTILATVIVLGVLIFVHELGHFLAAKAVGIGVPRFSIGFGPSTPLRFRRGETEYVVAWFPLGGYVKMASREEQEAMAAIEGGAAQEFPPEQLFENKSLPARIVVILAGVTMNALFAWVVYVLLTGVLGRAVDPVTTIAAVDSTGLPGQALPLARVPFGTRVVRVNGDTVRYWNDIQAAVVDPTSDRLRFDFADGVDPVVVPIPGTDAEARARIALALTPLWVARVQSVTPGSPAARAGIEAGDLIVRLAGDTVRAWSDISRILDGRAGEELIVQVGRGDSLIQLTVTPELQTELLPLGGGSRQAAKVGIASVRDLQRLKFGPLASVVEGTRLLVDDFAKVLFTLKAMVLGQISARELGGPILIGQVSGQFARLGAAALLTFMAFLSVNLAVLNLLPIPVLDGGQLVFLLAEGVRGRPLSLDTRMKLTQVGVLLLVGLVVLVFTNDIVRLLGG